MNEIKCKVWTPTKLGKLRHGQKPVKVEWVFKKKEEQDGSTREKGRIVVKGFMQIPKVDFTKIVQSELPNYLSNTCDELCMGRIPRSNTRSRRERSRYSNFTVTVGQRGVRCFDLFAFLVCCFPPFSLGYGGNLVVNLVALFTLADCVNLFCKLLLREELFPGAWFGLLLVPIFQGKAVRSIMTLISPMMGAEKGLATRRLALGIGFGGGSGGDCVQRAYAL